MGNFWQQVLGSTLGIVIVLFPINYFISLKFENRFSLIEKRVDSFFKPNSDGCSFVKFDKEKTGFKFSRDSDNRSVEVMWLYGCVNYKDWEEK